MIKYMGKNGIPNFKIEEVFEDWIMSYIEKHNKNSFDKALLKFNCDKQEFLNYLKRKSKIL